MSNLRLSFALLLFVGGAFSLRAQCPPDEAYPYTFCKNGELVHRCSSDPNHYEEDGVRLKPMRRELPGCIIMEQRQGIDVYMPTAVSGGSNDYAPVFLMDNQEQDIRGAFNQWNSLCPPTGGSDCCARAYFSWNPYDFAQDPDAPGKCFISIGRTSCRPTCNDEQRIYFNATPRWFYQLDSPMPSDTLNRAFFTGSRAPYLMPGYTAISLYQFAAGLSGLWFGMISSRMFPEVAGCAHPESVLENPVTHDSPIGLTQWDICQFKKLYCDREVGLDVYDENETGALSLSQNTPNPFSALTTISYSLAKSANVRLSLFDATGKEIKALIEDQHQEAGPYTFGFHADGNMPAGTYWYVLQVDNVTRTKQMILVK